MTSGRRREKQKSATLKFMLKLEQAESQKRVQAAEAAKSAADAAIASMEAKLAVCAALRGDTARGGAAHECWLYVALHRLAMRTWSKPLRLPLASPRGARPSGSNRSTSTASSLMPSLSSSADARQILGTSCSLYQGWAQPLTQA